MMGFLKRLATIVECKAAAYDRSIRLVDGVYEFTLRVNNESLMFQRASLKSAQRMMEMFEPEVFEGPGVPWSVFYCGGKL